MVFQQTLKYTGNQEEAEDLTQEIFLKAYEALSNFRGEAQFSTWLYKIAQSQIRMRYRKENTLPKSASVDFEEAQEKYLDKFKKWKDSITPEMQLLKQEMSAKMHSFISELPANYKKPLSLYYFENMSYKEIAEKMDIKMNTLKSYIFRGKEMIKEWWLKENE